MATRREGVTLRATSSTVVFIAILVVCVVLLGDAALRGRWDVVLAALPAAGLAVWVAVVVFARPCLRLDDAGLSIVNVLRTTDAPWSAVDDVTTRHEVVVTLKGGARIRCWGAPTTARSRPAAAPSADDRDRNLTGRVGGSSAHRVIDDVWSRHADDTAAGEISRTWHVASIVVGVAVTVVVVAQLVVAGLG